MIIDCISDLHGYYPLLEGGDLLLIAGDMTKNDSVKGWYEFYKWLGKQKYKSAIYIGGNHDNFLSQCVPNGAEVMVMGGKCYMEYLCDSGAEFEGLKIFGSPWTKSFEGMHPKCKAFTVDTEEELAKKFALIPEDTDILITHGPPLGIMDKVENFYTGKIEHTGSSELHKIIYKEKIRPKIHVFGHIHEGYGIVKYVDDIPHTKFINASYVNERYQPVNKPIRIEL